jgi:hypothetical protein
MLNSGRVCVEQQKGYEVFEEFSGKSTTTRIPKISESSEIAKQEQGPYT